MRLVLPFLLLTIALPLAAQEGSPAGPVPVARLEARRAALLDALGTGVAVLQSAELRSIEGDYPQDSDYREDNDFFYLTGLEAPGAWLVLVARADSADEVRLYLPARSPAAERWTGPRLGPGEEATRLTGVAETFPSDSVARHVARLLRGGGPLWAERTERMAEWAPVRQLLEGAGRVPGHDLRDLRGPVHALRLVKDDDELTRLRRAIALTADGQRAAAATIAPGRWEYQVEAALESAFRRGGAERLGFPSIVGSGPLSTVLHYDRARRQMQPGELVVVDIGAEFGYYSADVTRTWPVDGRFTERQRAIYDLVHGAQQAAIDSVRPGITVGELGRIARAWFDAHSGDTCGAEPCTRYFVHGLSHWLGMDVHDVGDYTTPLAPGMVITIEPGLYLPEEGFGVRIEDDVLVTATGSEVLSAAIPRAADAVERWMREARRGAGAGGRIP